MKHIIAFIFSICLVGLLNTNAQMYNSYGHLSIISEDNEPFFLYINGVKYNNQASLMVRVEELNQKSINCRIEFLSRKAPVVINNLNIADAQGYMQDITYALSSNRRGNDALTVYQVIPMDPINIDRNSITTFRYGSPRVQYQPNYSTGYRPGSSTTGGGRGQRGNRNNTKKCLEVNQSEFNNIRSNVKSARMDNDKLNLIQLLINERCFTTEQVIALSQMLSFSSNKLILFKDAYLTVLDPQMYYNTIKELSFSNERNELSNYINQNKR